MIRLEDLQPNAALRGILPDALVTAVSVQWYGSTALELTYKTPGGTPGNVLQDSYAYAESYDEAAARYRGLRAGQHIVVREDDKGLLVKPDVAKRQMGDEAAAAVAAAAARRAVAGGSGTTIIDTSDLPPYPHPGTGNGSGTTVTDPKPPVAKVGPKRYHGSVTLDPQRVGRDASRVAEEVLTHLAGLVNATYG